MFDVKQCTCGSPMSYFEEENYQKCGGCHQNEEVKAVMKEIEESLNNKEEEKRQEQLKKEQKILDERTAIENDVKKAIGKTIQHVLVHDWTEAGGQEAKTLELQFTDGTSLQFSQEEHADGCRGSYDYYPYLEAYFQEKK